MQLLFAIAMWCLAAFGGPSWTAPVRHDGVFVPREPELESGWVSYSSIYADVYHTSQDRKIALALSRHAASSIPRIAGELGVATGGAMQIYIAPDQESFSSLQPGRPPAWADGTAWPRDGLIFLRSPLIRDGRSSSMHQVLDHEIAHILLGRAFAHRTVPSWLQEGVAQLVAREYSPETVEALSAGSLADSLLSIGELAKGFPENPVQANLAYAQSADLVAFILQKHGRDALQRIIGELSSGTPFPLGIRRATGRSVEELDMEWRGGVETSLLWLQPLTADSALLAFGGLLLVYGMLRKTREKSVRFKEMDEQEWIQDALEKELADWVPYGGRAWHRGYG